MNASVNSINSKPTTADLLAALPNEKLELIAEIVGILADDTPKPAQVAQSAEPEPLPKPATDPKTVKEFKIDENLMAQIVMPMAMRLMQQVFNPVDVMTGQIRLQDVFDHMQDAVIETLPEWDHVALVKVINATIPASEGRYEFVPSATGNP